MSLRSSSTLASTKKSSSLTSSSSSLHVQNTASNSRTDDILEDGNEPESDDDDDEDEDDVADDSDINDDDDEDDDDDDQDNEDDADEEDEYGNPVKIQTSRKDRDMLQISTNQNPFDNDDMDDQLRDDDDDDAESEEFDDDDEYEEDLQKFQDYSLMHKLQDDHPEIRQVNYDEVMALSKVVRNSKGDIIDPMHTTLPIITKYEKARLIGSRAEQINRGAPPFVQVEPHVIDGRLIAMMEYEEKKIPYIFARPLPSGKVEYWKFEDLELL